MKLLESPSVLPYCLKSCESEIFGSYFLPEYFSVNVRDGRRHFPLSARHILLCARFNSVTTVQTTDTHISITITTILLKSNCYMFRPLLARHPVYNPAPLGDDKNRTLRPFEILLLLTIGPRWLMPRMYCSHIGLLYYP